ncbi:hypothetical protein Ahy_B10g102589 isoform B [Arachis hypogaea]|uniref:Uncharacterized protein n=1 Tax=Arachis hypogaea TaxID=3818 RepID=A0A444X292_ARAHY|nr:hypothetical protein Ahy_B10g102589 isoform B [Arachis hypogaea]
MKKGRRRTCANLEEEDEEEEKEKEKETEKEKEKKKEHKQLHKVTNSYPSLRSQVRVVAIAADQRRMHTLLSHWCMHGHRPPLPYAHTVTLPCARAQCPPSIGARTQRPLPLQT